MRKKIYTLLSSDSTLTSTVVGGWKTPYKVVAPPLPSTPFGVIRIAGELPDPLVRSYDKSAYTILSEIYIYDKRGKKDGTSIVSYASIDTAIKRIMVLMDRYRFDFTSDGWGYLETLYDMTSPDLYDDGWNAIFKYIRFSHQVTR